MEYFDYYDLPVPFISNSQSQLGERIFEKVITPEILSNIFAYLNYRDSTSISLTCKRWRYVLYCNHNRTVLTELEKYGITEKDLGKQQAKTYLISLIGAVGVLVSKNLLFYGHVKHFYSDSPNSFFECLVIDWRTTLRNLYYLESNELAQIYGSEKFYYQETILSKKLEENKSLDLFLQNCRSRVYPYPYLMLQGIDRATHTAAAHCRKEMTHKFLDSIPMRIRHNVNENLEERALIRACGWESDSSHEREDRLQTVKLLLERGADPNFLWKINSHTTISPLRCAAMSGYNQIVSLLIDNGAIIDNNAIVSAIRNNCIETVALLLTRVGTTMNTLLHAACEGGSVPIVALLLQKGFSINAVDEENRTPLDIVQQNQNFELREMLRAYGGKTYLEMKKEL